MVNRKDCKKKAKGSLKKHYILFVFLCLVAGVIGTSYTSSYTNLTDVVTSLFDTGESVEGEKLEDTSSRFILQDALRSAISDDDRTESLISDLIHAEEEKGSERFFGHIEVGRAEGVLAKAVNSFVSGAFIISALSVLYSVLGSAVASAVIFILISFILVMAVWMFFINVFKVVYARMFLEGRLYEYVPLQRLTFLVYVRRWGRAAWTMAVKTLFYTLWQLTIIGGIIKYYSYFAVPYILAERPGMKTLDAIRLSRQMMNGHKWECFKLHLSYLGWDLLNLATIGLSGIFFSNPYKEAARCEYYVCIRQQAKEKGLELADELQDTYLFEIPNTEVLTQTYGPVEEYMVKTEYRVQGAWSAICDFFGIYFLDAEEKEHAEYMKQKFVHDSVERVLAGKEYGTKFLALPVKSRSHPEEHLYFTRRYSIWSLILMFAIFSVIGWVWEVSLHLVQYGNFVNRGVLYGPWLPIYGTGGTCILLVLNKLRKKPVAEFFCAILLCGCIEYFIGLSLELTHGGQKWWSYDGFFLNIDGRVCAEGLLVFGIGGMAIVYLIAPLMDNLIRKIPRTVLIVVCVLFLFVFGTDKVYSEFHPNAGEGITSFNTQYQQEKKFIEIVCESSKYPVCRTGA